MGQPTDGFSTIGAISVGSWENALNFTLFSQLAGFRRLALDFITGALDASHAMCIKGKAKCAL